MNHPAKQTVRLLAVDPTTKGFGFAVLEAPARLVDWGVKHVAGDKNAESLAAVAELIDWYRPTAVVVEDTASGGARRCARVRRLADEIGLRGDN